MGCVAICAAAPPTMQTIPLTLYQGKQFTVEAVAGGKPRSFLFDTGEGMTMISPKLAAAAGCAPWGNVTAFRMLGERLDLQRCDSVGFDIGGTRYIAPTAIVYDLGKIAGPDAPLLDGAIGLDLFAGQTITIDLPSHRVVVESPATIKQRLNGAVEIPMRMSRPDGTTLDVNLGVCTPKGLAWMELDTGNAGPTIFVSTTMAPLFGLDPASRTPQDVTLELAPRQQLHTKARVFPGMVMDGNIGMQLARHHIITLDLKVGKAWLNPDP